MVLLVWHTIRQYNLPCTNFYILDSLLIVSTSNELQPHLCNLLAHSMANINDLEEAVTGSILKLADDTKLFRKAKEIGDKKNL